MYLYVTSRVKWGKKILNFIRTSFLQHSTEELNHHKSESFMSKTINYINKFPGFPLKVQSTRRARKSLALVPAGNSNVVLYKSVQNMYFDRVYVPFNLKIFSALNYCFWCIPNLFVSTGTKVTSRKN